MPSLDTRQWSLGDTRAFLSEKITTAAYVAGWKLTAKLPDAWARRLFNFGADLASKKGTAPEQLKMNLARVVGAENVSEQLVQQSMRSYMRYWREAFRLPRMAGPELAARVASGFMGHSMEFATNALHNRKADNRGVIFVLPHMGNWDMAGMWLVHEAGTFTTVAERLKPEQLYDAFVAYRESLGFRILAHAGGTTSPFSDMENLLNNNGVVCLMGDRDLTGKGIPVTFFGETAFMPTGAALLAQRTGARLLTVGIGYTNSQPEGWRIHIDELDALDRPISDVVQDQADRFAEYIATYPADWHMLQPMWARDLSAKRLEKIGFDLAGSDNPADRGEAVG